MALKNYYKQLGLNNFASTDEIKKAYRDLAFRYHPDHNKGGVNGAERFIEINEAYEFLLNPVKKRNLDAHLKSSHAYAPSYDFGKYAGDGKNETYGAVVEAEKIQKKNAWLIILKPAILILITAGLMFLIIKPPHWLKTGTVDKPRVNEPAKP